jgi:hypothetical protein
MQVHTIYNVLITYIGQYLIDQKNKTKTAVHMKLEKQEYNIIIIIVTWIITLVGKYTYYTKI